MRYSAPLWFCVLLLSGGCALRQEKQTVTPRVFALTEEEHEFAEALAHYADALVQKGEKGPFAPETLEAYRKAMVRDPDRRLLRAAVIEILNQHGDADEALDMLRSIADEKRNSAEAQIDVAVTASITGNRKVAALYYPRAIALEPGNVELTLVYSRLLFSENRDKEAIKALVKGYSHAKNGTGIRDFLTATSFYFIEKDQHQRAADCLVGLTEIEESPEAISSSNRILGDVYIQLENDRKAIQAYRKSIKANPTNVTAIVHLAITDSKKNPGRATRQLAEQIKANPSEERLYSTLANIHYLQADTAEALNVLKKLFRTDDVAVPRPFTLEVYNFYASLLGDTGRRQEANDILKDALQHYAENVRLLNHLAYNLALLGKELEYAEECAKLALSKEPQSGPITDTLGWVYYRMGRYGDALKFLLKAEELLKGDTEVLVHVGDALLALGRTEDAISYWDRAIKIDGSLTQVRKRIAIHTP